MKITVLLFAHFRDLLQTDHYELTFKEPPSISQIRESLIEKFPLITALLKNSIFSVNLNYQNDQFVCHPQDEIALIPPVNGG